MVSLVGRSWLQMAEVHSCLAWLPVLQGLVQAVRVPAEPQKLIHPRAECLHATHQVMDVLM